MAVITPEEIDTILDKIETSLQKVDASEGSMVKRTKAELDLLGHLESIRNRGSRIIKTGDRERLRELFGGDCTRIARLRAALNAVRLSDMNADDQRLPTCESVCSTIEKMLRDDLNLAAELAAKTANCAKELLHKRASLYVCPSPEQQALLQEVAAQQADGADEDEDDDLDSDLDDDDVAQTQETIAPTQVFQPPPRVETNVSASVEDSETSPSPDAVLMEEARNLFSQLDKNGDGKVTKTELKDAMKKSNGIKKALNLQSFKECSLFVDNADADQNGSLNFEEFQTHLASLRSSRSTSRSAEVEKPDLEKPEVAPTLDDAAVEEARSLFNQLDKNGDGKVTKTELKQSMQKSAAIKKALKLRSFKECGAFVDKADTDNNGSMDFDEFKVYLSLLRGSKRKPRSFDEATIRAAFEAMDRNGVGHLDLQALKLAYTGVLLSMGDYSASRKRVDRWAKRNLKKHDVDGSRTLDFEEFSQLLHRSALRSASK